MRRRTSRLLLAASLLFVGIAVGSTSFGAQDANAVFEPRPANAWGVAGLDPGSGNFQYFSPIFDIEQRGNRIYAGGKFLEVTNGATSIDQPYLAAFRQDNGDRLAGFQPDLDWSVFALATSGNRLFVGGEFPTVDDDPAQAGFAALDAATGRLDRSFGVRVGTNNGSQPRVHALEVSGSHLYIAGSFSWIEGSDGQQTQASRIARVDVDTGVVDTEWTPQVEDGAVWALAADPAHDRVLIGGLFRSINGESTPAFAVIDDATAELTDYDRGFGLRYFDQTVSDYDFASAIAVSGDRVVVGGQKHRLVVANSDLEVFQIYRTNRFDAANAGRGGDIQDIEIHGDRAYIACHCWGQIMREDLDMMSTGDLWDVRSTWAVDIDDGSIVTSFQPDLSGRSGPWALHVDDDGCLWSGTDATQAGQAAARGLIKSCPTPNLAAGATATLLPAPDDPADAASFAVDGNLVSNRTAASGLARSGAAVTPALDLDLGQLVDADSITVWMPTDRVDPGLQNLRVWTSVQPLPSHQWRVLRDDPAVSELVRNGDHTGKRSITIDLDRPVRYIRVEADFRGGDNRRLVLTEVTVAGTPTVVGPPFELVSTLQTRERVVLRWSPGVEVTVARDGVVLGVDGDGWFTDLGLEAGTSYSYVVTAADGRSAELTVSTQQ